MYRAYVIKKYIFNHLELIETYHAIREMNYCCYTAKEFFMVKHAFHAATSRGRSQHGWLNSYHTFSFADYYDPQRMQFGMLRVLNDDIVSGGMGFSTHPHRDMEIISIPLSGTLEHRDSMGNIAVIEENEVQLMSAGTGVKHSEFNKHPQHHVNFLQIWVLPQQLHTRPRYDQQHFELSNRMNQWQTIVSPLGLGEKGCQINQAAWFSRGHLQAGASLPYLLRAKGQGVYIFVISGEILVHSHVLKTRDALGIWNTSDVLIHATKESDVLLMDVPM